MKRAVGDYVIEERRVRLTGTVVAIYDTAHPDNVFDPDGGRYVVVCEDHGTLCNFESLRLARQHVPAVDWCEACMQALHGPQAFRGPVSPAEGG